MEAEVAIRTGLPLDLVRQVVDALKQVMRESIFRQQDIVLRGLFRISTTMREINTLSSRKGEPPERQEQSKLLLGIRPTRGFREELNLWTSSLLLSKKT